MLILFILLLGVAFGVDFNVTLKSNFTFHVSSGNTSTQGNIEALYLDGSEVEVFSGEFLICAEADQNYNLAVNTSAFAMRISCNSWACYGSNIFRNYYTSRLISVNPPTWGEAHDSFSCYGDSMEEEDEDNHRVPCNLDLTEEEFARSKFPSDKIKQNYVCYAAVNEKGPPYVLFKDIDLSKYESTNIQVGAEIGEEDLISS
mmetsp:Transcript_10060/g.11453  ORF Transcript_10060/g.11453 Transcript_10060/m.11453 type:complete len:202 (-) Transcript_10060:41-646(-)